jgi:hypothetical protein
VEERNEIASVHRVVAVAVRDAAGLRVDGSGDVDLHQRCEDAALQNSCL